MNNPHNPIARQNGIVVQELTDEVLVYDLDSNRAHCLNRSAAIVWKSCDGNNTVSDIAMQFDGKVSEDFVWLALEQLNESSLLQNDIAPAFSGKSRRHVLKAMGLASMVALPMIASLVAPSSALGAVNCVCTSNTQCSGLACPSTTNCNQAGVCAPSLT